MAAGSAVLGMPAFLHGCGVVEARDPRVPAPRNPFMAWFGIDDAVLSRTLSELSSAGADSAELYFQHRRAQVLTMSDGVVTGADAHITQGVGLRVVRGDASGFAFTEELNPESLLAAARLAAQGLASSAAIDTSLAAQQFSIAAPGTLYRTVLPWSEVGMDRKIPRMERVDRGARAVDPTVTQVEVRWADSDERILIATLDGRVLTDHRPLTSLSAQVTATRNTQSQSGFAGISARADLNWYDDERIDRLVADATDRTLILFDSRRPPTGDLPVILPAGSGGILLHEAIGHGLEADFIWDGNSVFSGVLGEQVAGPFVSVVDQATLANERGALNVDDEGTAGQRTVLVKDGELRSLLHDTRSARQYGAQSTGSARRQSYRFEPLPRMTCTYVDNGPHTREEIIAGVEHGIIAETFTDGRVGPGLGDYEFQVKHGWLVERGRVTAPLRDLRLSGNGRDTLRNMTMVADDLTMHAAGWTCGKRSQQVPVSHGMPTVLVSSLQVGPATDG